MGLGQLSSSPSASSLLHPLRQRAHFRICPFRDDDAAIQLRHLLGICLCGFRGSSDSAQVEPSECVVQESLARFNQLNISHSVEYWRLHVHPLDKCCLLQLVPQLADFQGSCPRRRPNLVRNRHPDQHRLSSGFPRLFARYQPSAIFDCGWTACELHSRRKGPHGPLRPRYLPGHSPPSDRDM